MTAANSLPPGVPGVSSAGTPAEPQSGSPRPVAMDAGGADRYYLWEAPGRQSGPYTHNEMLALIDRARSARVAPALRYVVSVTPEQLDILDSLRTNRLTARQLAEDTGKTPDAIREHLRNLGGLRLVVSTQGRPAQWAITPRGRQALDQLDPGAP